MKILFIKPHHKKIYKSFKCVATEYPPLGLVYIAAILEKNGYNVRIIDMSVEHMAEPELIKILKEFSPDLIGITATTATINYSFKLASICKKILPNSFMVFGGPHPTALPEESLSNKNIDVVVKAEGEYTFLELVKELEKPKPNFKKIKGIVFKNGKKFIRTGARAFIENLDELPFPARHLLPIKKYFYVDVKATPMTTMFTSRGCPRMCIYCSSRNIFGGRFRSRSAKNVVNEIEHVVDVYGIKELHFLDDTFTLDKKRVVEICKEIKKRKIDIFWCCPNGIRVNTVDKELLVQMKKVGCYSLAFGIESGSQEILNKVKKGITLDQARNAFKLCKEVGIETWGFFMLGLPGDNEKTIRKTIDFAKELDPDIAKFHITIPLPGTELFDMWKKQGIIKSEDWDDYGIHTSNVIELPNISMKRLKKLHKQAYKEFYLRPKYIFKYLKRINSFTRLINSIKAGSTIIKYTIN